MPPLARRLLITVVVLLAVLVAVDRIGDYAAERVAADTIQSSQHLDDRPAVDIAGFPFLTQLAAGSFDEVTITAKHVPVGQARTLLDLSRVRVVLHSVDVARDFSSVRAGTADAQATVAFPDLGKTLGIDVSDAGNGRVRASKSVTVLGHTVTATVTSRPEIVNGGLSFAGTQINNAAALGGSVTRALQKIFDLDIPFQGIPFHIRVTSLRVDQQGIVVALTGRDLSYSK